MSQETLLRDALRVLNVYAAVPPTIDWRQPLETNLRIVREALDEHVFDEAGIQRDGVLNVVMRLDDELPDGGGHDDKS